MDVKGRQQVKALFERAVALPPEQRPAFLEEACGSDASLHGKLTSMLRAHDSGPSFLDTPTVAPGGADPLPGPGLDPFIGRKLGRYHVTEKIGAGGMGVVYRAEDERLRRTVALKFLPPQHHADKMMNQRFIQEAQAASALDHPNICTIHEIGETTDGYLYIAMANYDGETLKERMAGGPLPMEEAVNIATQVARGLRKAAQNDIVHRDIKPANVMLTDDNIVKILDFGLAKMPDTELTATGTTMGTVAYMSPEQARGDHVDHRTDIWSLGVILYEMLTGRRPFQGDNMARIVHAILNVDPPAVDEYAPTLPATFPPVLAKLLSKDVDNRYPTMDAVLADFRVINPVSSSSSVTVPVATDSKPSIAVLPFLNLSNDPENAYFCDGLAEELINGLNNIRDLRVAARTSSFAFKDRPEDIQKIGQKLRVSTLLEGSVRTSGKRIRVSAQLVNVSDGYHLWSDRYDRVMDDVFAIQDEISLAIVDKLKPELLGGEKEALVKRHTEDLEAYTLYLKGRHHWERRTEASLQQAIEYFERAIREDPGYAKAHAGLADCSMIMGFYGYQSGRDVYPKAQAAARQALQLDGNLAEAYVSLAAARVFHDHDWAGAEADFRRAIELNPSYPTAHHLYGGFVMLPTGRIEEAIGEIRRALELDPLNQVFSSVLAYHYWWNRDYDRVLTQALRTLKLNPDFWLAHTALGIAYEQQGLFEKAVASFEKAMNVSRANPLILGMLGHVHGLSGSEGEARGVLHRLEGMAEQEYVSAYDVAVVHLGLGDDEQVFAWLDRAYEQRAAWLVLVNVDPRFDRLHADPRFASLRTRLQLGT